VAHCTGGAGADNFDPVGALEKWVEQGIAPDRIVATKFVSGAVQFTRPLCAYPAVPFYDGGDPKDASSFVCR
jgi:tannase/feruloyl esterase